MTHQENIEAVRRACVAANPSIMELGFGCEVINQYSVLGRVTNKGFVVRNSENYIHVQVERGDVSFAEAWLVEEFTILGRSIRLADVLLAMPSNSVIKINNLGGFSWLIDGEWKDIAMPRYNLLKDDLSLQSQETVEFLASLLK